MALQNGNSGTDSKVWMREEVHARRNRKRDIRIGYLIA